MGHISVVQFCADFAPTRPSDFAIARQSRHPRRWIMGARRGFRGGAPEGDALTGRNQAHTGLGGTKSPLGFPGDSEPSVPPHKGSGRACSAIAEQRRQRLDHPRRGPNVKRSRVELGMPEQNLDDASTGLFCLTVVCALRSGSVRDTKRFARVIGKKDVSRLVERMLFVVREQGGASRTRTNRPPSSGNYRITRAPLPFMIASTSLTLTIEVSPGVVIASAPCAAPYSTAACGPLPSRKA